MRADEGVDITKMAVNCFLALIVLSSVIGLLALSQKLWGVFSREQTQNKINQAYAEVAAYDNNVVTGQDLISKFMGSKGKFPIYIGAVANIRESKIATVGGTDIVKSINDPSASPGANIGLRGYMGDCGLLEYNSSLFKQGIYFYSYGDTSNLETIAPGGKVSHVVATAELDTYIKVSGGIVNRRPEPPTAPPPTNDVFTEDNNNRSVSIDYYENGREVLNGTLLPLAQRYIKYMYKLMWDVKMSDDEPKPSDYVNETYGYWYSLVIYEDENCTQPCGLYVEPIYYVPPES